MIQGDFFNWSRPKSSKCWRWQNPYQKSESKGISQRKYEILTQTFTFLVEILPSPRLRTFRAEPVKKNHPVENVVLRDQQTKFPPMQSLRDSRSDGKISYWYYVYSSLFIESSKHTVLGEPAQFTHKLREANLLPHGHDIQARPVQLQKKNNKMMNNR